MGTSCISTCSTQKKNRHKIQTPLDIQSFAPVNLPYALPKLTLKGQIYNIQLTNFNQKYVSLKFNVSDVISIALPQKQINVKKQKKNNQNENEIKWKMHQQFTFSLNQYQLRTHFLNVQIYGENRAKLTQLSVNLFMIVTGPHQHDFQISKGSQVLGRLLFNFKVSQIIDLRLDIDSVDINFDKDLSGQQFDHSFKVLTHNQVLYESQPNGQKVVTVDNSSQNYRQYKVQDQCQSPMKIIKDSHSKKMVKMQKQSNVKWKGLKNTSNIKIKLQTNQLNHSFLYLILWKINKQSINHTDQGAINGYALIKFNKIIEREYEERQITIQNQKQEELKSQQKKISYKIQERTLILQQKIWFEGQVIGSCKINFKMENPHYFKQMEACSRTQDGVVNMTFLFKNYGTLNLKAKNQQINKILKTYEKIQSLSRKKDNLQQKNYESRRKNIQYQHQIQANFQNIYQSLQSTLSQSFVFGSKGHASQMIYDQKILLDLLGKLYFFIIDGTVHSLICWKIVVSIMKRGQLYLQNIGFVQKTQDEQIYQKKIKLAIQYQNVMYKYLIYAIKFSYLNFQGAGNKHIQAFKAQCYFKIPQYRDYILHIIQKKYDQDVIQFKLQDLQTMTSEYSSLLKSRYQNYMINLDWKRYFYQKIQGIQSYKQTSKQLQEQLENCQWVQELSKRQEAFYQFTAEIMKRLNELSTTIKLSKWNYFPGYTKIVRGFLVQMKKKKVLQFSTQMINTSVELLAHEDLINILMPLVVQKVNGFDQTQLSLSLSLIHMFLQGLTDKRTKAIPRTFNYVFFFKTMKAVFQLDNIEGTSKMLIILYDFYQWFSYDWRDNFTMYIMGKIFFKFFFHWSYQVRLLFYNILIIKIHFLRIKKISQQIKLSDKEKNTIQMNTTIAQRYDTILIILANAESIKKSQNKDFSWFEKQLYKRMKKKKQRQKSNKRKLSQNFGVSQNNFKDKEMSRYSLQNLLNSNSDSFNMSKSKLTQQIRTRSRTTFQLKPALTYTDNDQTDQNIEIVRGNSIYIEDQVLKSLSDLKNEGKSRKYSGEQEQSSIQNELTLNRHLTETNKRRGNKNSLSVLIPDNKKKTFVLFQPQDHELQELKKLQTSYILKGLQQYKDALNGIQKYLDEKGQLPTRNMSMDEFDAKMSQNA